MKPRLSNRNRNGKTMTAVCRPYFAVVLLLALSSPCMAQTPRKIIDEYLRAEGGAKAMAKVQSLTIAGSLREESTDTNGSYSLITKSPNKFYSEIVIEPQHTIAAYNTPAVKMAKEAVNRAFESSLAEGLRHERLLFQAAFATEGQKEGMNAFVAKRAPVFRNR